jgi:hypothetical protein
LICLFLDSLFEEEEHVKKALSFALLVVFPIGLWAPRGQADGRDEKLQKLMEAKLKNSQLLLEGMALADFGKITRSAEKLLHITKTDEWMVINSRRYEALSNEFQRSVETVLRKARAKNLDGVALSYFEMTLNCLRCHQYVHEVKGAD